MVHVVWEGCCMLQNSGSECEIGKNEKGLGNSSIISFWQWRVDPPPLAEWRLFLKCLANYSWGRYGGLFRSSILAMPSRCVGVVQRALSLINVMTISKHIESIHSPSWLIDVNMHNLHMCSVYLTPIVACFTRFGSLSVRHLRVDERLHYQFCDVSSSFPGSAL